MPLFYSNLTTTICNATHKTAQATVLSRSPLLSKLYPVTSLSLSKCVFSSPISPLQVKMTGHGRLKDKVTFHADAGAARGGERRPSCPLVSLNIHWRVDGVHSAWIRVVLKNFTLRSADEPQRGQAGARKADGTTSVARGRFTLGFRCMPTGFLIGYGFTLGNANTKTGHVYRVILADAYTHM